MYKSNALLSFVLILYTAFVVYLLNEEVEIASSLSSLICPAIAIIYFLLVKKKTLFFSLFLIFFSVSEIMNLLAGRVIPHLISYFIGNGLYVIAYFTLLLEICKKDSVAHLFKNFKIHLIVLTALDVYIIYFLQDIIAPFISIPQEYALELVYNIVMLVLLSAALLNYFHRDDKKSLLLFLGSLCIVFAEVIGVAYLYIKDERLLSFLSTTLFLLAFLTLLRQSKMEYVKSKRLLIDEL
ncbi:hypothetical protein [Aestuariivivens insulae]|uniref:hypothetical protein n=1 Tax=Aestuariivivens insulae TaxID=1621988 RepID=UPI001F58C718|nr:hypothetical protein [Aestuariivivens insulae]